MSDVTEESGTEQGGGNRRALILAAYARIASAGFEGLRTRDVAADVGVNIGTLHYYFPSKEALIRAAAQHMLQRFEATVPRGGAPADQLRGHLDALRQLLKTDPEVWAVSSETALRAARDCTIAGMVQQSEEQWFRFLRGLVTQGIAEGSLGANLIPDEVASTLMAAVKGLSMPWPGAFRPQQIDQTFAQLARWLGLRPPTSPATRED